MSRQQSHSTDGKEDTCCVNYVVKLHGSMAYMAINICGRLLCIGSLETSGIHEEHWTPNVDLLRDPPYRGEL